MTPRALREQALREHAAAAPASWTNDDRAVSAPLTLGQHDGDRVLAALGPHPIDIDELARATALGAREMRVLLMELDLAGEITRHGFQLVSRSPDKL